MPTVPTYERQVRETGIPNIRSQEAARPGAFGVGSVFEAPMEQASNLIKTVATIAIKERQSADALAVQDADLQLSLRQSRREAETTALLGKDAATAPEKVKPNWESDIAEITDTLTNDQQKAEFSRKAFARDMIFNEYLQKHVSTQLDQYDKDTTDSYLTNAQREASTHPYDTQRVGLSILQQEQAIRMYGERRGDSPELIQKRIQDATQSTHIGVMDRLISNSDYDSAENYLNTVKSDIPGDQVSSVQKLIESGRRQLKDKTEEKQSEIDKALFQRTLPGAKDPLGLDELNNLAKNGTINRTIHNQYVNLLTNPYNNKQIADDQKVAKLYEISDEFMKLNGAEVKPYTLEPTQPTSKNRIEDINKFRTKLFEAAPYLDEKIVNGYLMATQKDLTDDDTSKMAIFMNMIRSLKNLAVKTPSTFIAPFLPMLDKSVPVEKAMEKANEIKKKSVITSNPRASRYAVGEVYTNSKGLKAKCVALDEQGNPSFDLVK